MKRFFVILLLACAGLVIGGSINTTEVAAAEQIKLNFVSDYPERTSRCGWRV